jgi:taurine dioxygenase
LKVITGLQNISSDSLLQLLYQEKVLVIKKSGLTIQGFLDLARSWGEVIRFVDEAFHHPEEPDIFVVSNRREQSGKKIGMDRVGHYWHSDGSFLKQPQPLSLLWCRRAPLEGGETDFLDMCRLLAKLDDELLAQLSCAKGLHDGLYKYIISEQDLGLSIEEIISRDRSLCPPVEHPAVIRHPFTGQSCLYVNPGFTSSLIGVSPEVLKVLFNLIQHSTDVMRHHWEEDDLVIWDNRSVIHRAFPAIAGDREMFRLGVRDGVFYA